MSQNHLTEGAWSGEYKRHSADHSAGRGFRNQLAPKHPLTEEGEQKAVSLSQPKDPELVRSKADREPAAPLPGLILCCC